MAKFNIYSYQFYNTITKPTTVQIQVALDEEFKNLLLNETMDITSVEEFHNALLMPNGRPLDEDTVVYVRVKIFNNNSSSKWYLLKLDKSKIIRFYQHKKPIKELVYNKNGNLFKEINIAKPYLNLDNFDLTLSLDFLTDYLDHNYWSINRYQYFNYIYDYKGYTIELSELEGWLVFNSFKEGDITYRAEIDFNEKLNLNGKLVDFLIDEISGSGNLEFKFIGNKDLIGFRLYKDKIEILNRTTRISTLDFTNKNFISYYLKPNKIEVYLDHQLEFSYAVGYKSDSTTFRLKSNGNDGFLCKVNYINIYDKTENVNIPS